MLEVKPTLQTLPTPEQTPETEQFSEKIVQNIGDVAIQASKSSDESIQPQRISDDHIFSRYALPLESGQILSPRKTPNTKYVSPKRK